MAKPLAMQEANPIGRFILDFRDWLSRQFHRSICAARCGTPTPTELVETLRPWVDELLDFINPRSIPTLTSAEAIELRALFHHALDRLNDCHRVAGESSAGILMTLSPLDDVLVYLSFRATDPVKRTAAGGG
jgi:hypothetical protein